MATKLDPRALGEFGLIDALRRRARVARSAWSESIGDDAAVLRPRPNTELVLTADALVEDIHFRFATTDARSLGHKALAVNLSDLAAMGATPRGFLLSLALPPIALPERLEGFVSGLLATAKKYRCPLVGGDIVSSPVWMFSITAVGEVPRGKALLRRGARIGDRIMLSGDVGGSALGLQLLEASAAREPRARPFVRRHLRPTPRVEAGERLLRWGVATAVIDVSDGVVQDLGHIAQFAGSCAEIDVEDLPLPRGFRAACSRLGLEAHELALAGGEDFELLFTVGPNAPAAKVFSKRLGCPISEIGVLRRGRGVVARRGGEPLRLSAGGFEHFKTLSLPSDK